MRKPNHFFVGALATNGPGRQGFLRFGKTYGGLDDAVQAAVAHWSENFGDGKTPKFRVYRADDGRTAFVEILDTEAQMSCLALFKIVGMFASSGSVPPPEGVASPIAP